MSSSVPCSACQPKHLLGARVGGDQNRRIAGAPWAVLVRHALTCHGFGRVQHLAHGEARA